MSRLHPGWDTFVAAHPHGHLLQTTPWGEFKACFGWKWELVTLGTGEPEAQPKAQPKAGALVLFRRLPLGLGTLAYVPRGPVLSWDGELFPQMLAEVERVARARRARALWLEPEAFDTPELRAQLREAGLHPVAETVQPPRTIHVDLTPGEDEILARMKSKTRYNIRLARRKGVVVREGTVDDAGLYYALMEETGERNEFGIHAAHYYREALERFLPRDQAALLIAEVEGEAVAAIIVFALGEKAWYFYGASSERHREKMPTYALQWAAMRWARRRGCRTYDLWGIPDHNEAELEAKFTERSDGLWGVYRFKRGFGGEVVRYVGLWEHTLHPLYPLAARLRRRLKRTNPLT